MKKQIIGGYASLLVLTIVFSSIQTTEAVPYVGHDGSVSEYLEKVVVKPYANKKDMWVYMVKVCATDHNMGIAGVVLKSDIDEQVLGVNKTIKKGDCSHYGAVMNAKDGKTLGAELITKSDASARMIQILTESPDMTDKERKDVMKEFSRLYQMTGLLPRL